MSQRPNKAGIIWNVQEPDDPYDIKKSMIAKLPDHPPKPMGQYLEVVCLLQSAQIERLSDFLAQMKAKYRQMERKELDRHSYQIQIKELAQKTVAYNTVKSQNDRLKDFIRRQTLQLQGLQKTKFNSISLQALQAKYQGVLNELKISRQQKQRLQITISKINNEVTQWRGKWQRSELEKASQKSQFQVQIRERVAIQLRLVSEKTNQRNQKLQIQIRQLKQFIQNKNQEISSLLLQKDQFIRQIRLLQEKNRNRGNIEESLNEKNREIQRLNIQITEKSNKLEQVMSSMQKLGGQSRILEERYFSLQKQNQTLLIRVRESEHLSKNRDQFDRYEDKIAMMSMEIERLNGLHTSKGRENAQLNAQLERSKLQLLKMNSLREQIQRQRDRLKHLQNDSHIKAAHENRIILLNQELQRVNMQLKMKNQQYFTLNERFKSLQMNSSQLNILSNENNRLKQQLQASRTELWNYKNITQNQLKSLRNQHSKLLRQFQQIQGSHSQTQKFRTQCDRLRAELDRIRNESIMIKRGVEEQRANNSRYISEINKLVETNNKLAEDNIRLSQDNKRLTEQIRKITIQILQINTERQQLILHINQNESRQDTIRALHEELQSRRERNEHLQTTVQKIYGEIDRLHALLSGKTTEHLRVSKQYAQLEERYKFLEAKINNTVGQKDFYQKQINRLKIQLEGNSRFNSDAQRQIQSKTRQFLLEKQRYERLIIQNEKLMAQHIKERETLERKLIDLQRQLASRVPQEQQLKKEQQRTRQQLRTKETLILQLQTTIRQKQIYFREGQDRSKQFEIRVNQWQNRLKQAERSIYIREQQKQQILQENKRILQQKERLNQEFIRVSQDLKRLSQQSMRFNAEMSRITQQNSKIKLDLSRLNEQLAKQGDIHGKYRREEESKFREKWDSLNQQNLKLRMKIDQLSSVERVRTNEQQLKTQIIRIEQTLRNEKIESQNLRMQLRRCEQLINRQNLQIQSLKQSTKEYQLKIVHIEAANSKHFQERLKQQESRLQDQLRQSQLRLQQKESLIVTMQRDINQLEGQLRILMERDRSSLNNLDQYQDKIGLLSVELQRVNGIIREKTLEYREKDALIERLQIQIRDLSQSRRNDNDQRSLIEIANLKTALQELQNINMHTIAERDELFKICHQIKSQHQIQLAKISEDDRRIKSELQFRGEESRRFGQQVGILRKKEQTYLAKIRELEEISSRPQEDPNLRRRLNELQTMVSSQMREIQELKIQNTNLLTEIRQMEIILHQEQQKRQRTSREQTVMLNAKVNEYVVLINSKDEEIAMWQNKYTSLYAAYEQLYLNFNLTKSEYQVTINNVRAYQQKLFQLQQDFSSLSESFRLSRNEIERLKVQNRELRIQIDNGGDLYQKNLLLSKQIDRLTQINKSMKSQLQQIRLRMSDNVSLSKRIQEHMALFVVLFAQIQALRSRLVNSEQECEKVRRSSLVPLRVDKGERKN